MTKLNTDPTLILRVRRRKNASNHDHNPLKSLRLVGIADAPPLVVSTTSNNDNNNKNTGGGKKRSLEERFGSCMIDLSTSENMIDVVTKSIIEEQNQQIQEYHQQPPTKRRPALWKLVTTGEEQDNLKFDINRKKRRNNNDVRNHHRFVSNNNQFNKKRIVTAVLDDLSVHNDDQAQHYSGGDMKRCKLSIVSETMTDASIVSIVRNDGKIINKTNNNNKKKSFKILHPLERFVDDSMKDVFQGIKSIQQHLNFIIHDGSLISTTNSTNVKHTWILWSNVEYGNILHACSMWNDLDMVQQVLELLRNGDNKNDLKDIAIALTTRDSNDKTPYDIAKLVGHFSICDVLKSYCDSIKMSKTEDCIVDDAEQYEYDIYFLQTHDGDEEENDIKSKVQHQNESVTCELQNGQYGYWNVDGELIISLANENEYNQIAGGVDGELDADDDDEDSNHENFIANDYPDEDEYNNERETFVGSSSDDDDDEVDQTYRHRQICHQNSGDDDDESYSGMYDPSYGIPVRDNDEEYDDHVKGI